MECSWKHNVIEINCEGVKKRPLLNKDFHTVTVKYLTLKMTSERVK